MADTPHERPSRGHLRLVRGDATPEEIATLVAVLAARSAPAAPPRRPRSTWADPGFAVRGPVAAGPDGWARSARAAGARLRPGG